MKLRYQFVTTEIDDSIMAVPIGDGDDTPHGILRLNETSFEIFEMLQNEVSEQEIVERFVEKYGQLSDEAEADVRDCLRKLKESGLVE